MRQRGKYSFFGSIFDLAARPVEWEIMRLIGPFLRGNRSLMASAVVLGILASLAEGLGISLIIPFLQSLERTGPILETGNVLIDSLSGFFNRFDPENRLFVVSAGIFLSVLLSSFLAYGHSVLTSLLESRVGHDLRSGIFKELLAVSYSRLHESRSGDLWNTLASESWRAIHALSAVVHLIVTATALFVYAMLLLLISWKLTLLVSVVMLLIAFLVRILTRSVRLLGERANRANAALADRMVEGFAGMKVIRAFGREGYEQKRFDHSSEEVSRVFFRLGALSGIIGPVYEILTAALLVTVLILTFNLTQNLPAVLVFVFVLYRLQPRIKQVQAGHVHIDSLKASVQDVASFLHRAALSHVSSGHRSVTTLSKGLRFDHISFYYGEADRPALRDVGFSIPAGKMTALVGPSGAGKSTIVNLILRFYEPVRGEITVDDMPLRDIDLKSWRSRIALVSQDVYLFDRPVRENIAYGRPDATEMEIIEAAEKADAHTFIMQLPQGYDTVLGERGVRLSGGQQQRIALARAILRDPELLILDEATNALDSISENVIQQALTVLRHRRTILVIAHRLSTIEQADHIVVLDNGLITEQGGFRELLQKEGLFATLYQLQRTSIEM